MSSYMKCQKCGGVAVIGMPQHRLNLCAAHFVEWVLNMVRRAIQKQSMFGPDDRILVAVSGGKDSLSLWDILIRLGYRTEGLYIHLGIEHESYSDLSQRKVEDFCAEHEDVPFRVVNVAETYGKGVPELRHTRRGLRVCSACGLVKRHIMNQVAYEEGFAAIATGHNLDDEAATLMQNVLHWQTDYLARQAPVLPESDFGLARKVKPLCFLYERETAAYALVREISFVEQECPFAARAKTIYYKKILNQLEHASPGTKAQFYRHFIQVKEQGDIQFPKPEPNSPEAPHTCSRCGQPTLAPDLCSFCRLWERAS